MINFLCKCKNVLIKTIKNITGFSPVCQIYDRYDIFLRNFVKIPQNSRNIIKFVF